MMRRSGYISVAAGVLMTALAVAGPSMMSAANASDITTTAESTFVLAQESQTSGSSTRVSGRSVRGMIGLAALAIGGVGWVIKKMTGGGSQE
jgi:hypothetical protein